MEFLDRNENKIDINLLITQFVLRVFFFIFAEKGKSKHATMNSTHVTTYSRLSLSRLISNTRLSRSEDLVPALAWKCNNR